MGYTQDMAKYKALGDVIRSAIQTDGRSAYQLWKDSGVAQAILSRFIRGERDLTLGTADRLCRELNLELRSTKKAGRR